MRISVKRLAEVATFLEDSGLSFEQAQLAVDYGLLDYLSGVSEKVICPSVDILNGYSILARLFIWSDTPEGFDYWYDLHTLMRKRNENRT